MKREKVKSSINEKYKTIKKEYLFEAFFILSNLINAFLMRSVTVKNVLSLSPLLVDLSFLILVSLISLFLKKKKDKVTYFFVVSIILISVCLINSIYYHYYSSYASISLISNLVFASSVSDAIVENVIKPVDLIYIWQILGLYLFYKHLKKNKYFDNQNKRKNKKVIKNGLKLAAIFFVLAAPLMPLNAWGRLYKLWNRESVVMNFGVYTYQLDDFIQSLTPKINGMFGHDKSLKEVRDFYEENNKKHEKNEYTNIFKGKNIIVIHAESIQTFPMNLTFNGKEVTPNLNRLSKEGMFFSNFYSQVGVGTSSDAEFTFNTSLMPSTTGTVFVNYFDRDYVAMPNLLKEKGYYTFSMHANTGEFWNRNVMHKTLGYDKFYSKDSYEIDETIGLGLSDKSFFTQSVEIIKDIKKEQNKPYYGLLIMLSNHTPFSDLELTDPYPTTIDIAINNETITKEYLNETVMGNYLRSVHYADQSIGLFIDSLDKEGLLEDTIIVIYGDHDARLSFKDYNRLYNYDPITDTIRTEKDEDYIPYNKYNYELDRKVPFIIWSKDTKLNKEITTPTGMIDVLPTLGNMIGIESDYQIGMDILSIENNDNTVVFTDESFLTSKIYYNAPKGEIYQITNDPITEDYIKKRIKYSRDIIEVSNDIISYNLINELRGKYSK